MFRKYCKLIAVHEIAQMIDFINTILERNLDKNYNKM